MSRGPEVCAFVSPRLVSALPSGSRRPLMTRTTPALSRREVLLAGIAGGVALALHAPRAQSAQAAPILKAIPSSGEKIPVIGLGTNAYGVTDAAELASRKEVLQRMSGLGGRVIDTAAG